MSTTKDIKQYEHLYTISTDGIVTAKSRPTNGAVVAMTKVKKLSGWDNGKGYRVVTLMTKNKRKNHYIHRLVALHFIDNPLNYKEINHKDGNKSNNNISNLEWISRSGNIKHAYNTGLRSLTPKMLKVLKKGREDRHESYRIS
jgi:hypothetical protein